MERGVAIGLMSAVLVLSACSSGGEGDNAVAANIAAPGTASPVADQAPALAAATASGGIADGKYSCHKLSGGMLVNMGEFRVSDGRVDTRVLESAGATFKGVEPTKEGFRLNYESKSGWAEVMDCEPT